MESMIQCLTKLQTHFQSFRKVRLKARGVFSKGLQEAWSVQLQASRVIELKLPIKPVLYGAFTSWSMYLVYKKTLCKDVILCQIFALALKTRGYKTFLCWSDLCQTNDEIESQVPMAIFTHKCITFVAKHLTKHQRLYPSDYFSGILKVQVLPIWLVFLYSESPEAQLAAKNKGLFKPETEQGFSLNLEHLDGI